MKFTKKELDYLLSPAWGFLRSCDKGIHSVLPSFGTRNSQSGLQSCPATTLADAEDREASDTAKAGRGRAIPGTVAHNGDHASVADGASPNSALYSPGNRPNCQKPYRVARSVTSSQPECFRAVPVGPCESAASAGTAWDPYRGVPGKRPAASALKRRSPYRDRGYRAVRRGVALR